MRKVKIHIAISTIGLILGYSAFITFAIAYSNTEAGIWAFVSGLEATLACMLHYFYWKGTLQHNISNNGIIAIEIVSMVGFVIGSALMMFYIFLQIYWKTPMMPIDSSVVIRIVWSFMMAKWGLLLHLAAKKYSMTISDEPLFTENPNIQEI